MRAFRVAAVSLCVAAPAAASNGRCLPCHGPPLFDAEALAASVHAKLACVDCHKGQDAAPHRAAPPKLSDKELAIAAKIGARSPAPAALALCGRCHESQRDEWMESAHGGGTCLDCHGSAHAIKKGVSKVALASRCTSCHGAAKTRDTTHARALALGRAKAPACADCHGAHDVAASQFKTAAARATLCAGCHKGASDNFAATFAHVPARGRVATATAATVLSWLTALTLVGLVFHGLYDVRSRVRLRLKSRRGELPEQPPPLRGAAKRFDRHQLAQHALGSAAVVALVASHWLRLPVLHRIAGVALLIAGLYHLVYAIARRRHAQAFSVVEKLDRFALLAGIGVMFVTGLSRWFPVGFARVLPASLLEAMRAVHAAALPWVIALFLWHLYVVHVRPAPAEVKP